ncbi:MAG: MFS transporter, partial [Mycobacterium sp.]
IWAVIVAGVGFMTAFVYWQSINTHEPLIPLDIFRDRDFSLSNLGVAVIGFAVTAMILPLMFYAQAVCDLSPTRSALLIAPMAITSGLLAPIVGRIVDRSHPRPVVGFGFSVLATALTWLSIEMTPSTPIWRLVLPFIVLGVGMAFVWQPLAATATRNLPVRLAGAGSGVYNATRQVGAVLGSASIAAFMTWRITAEMPPMAGGRPQQDAGAAVQLPEFLHEPFSAAMSQSLLLPAFVALFGVTAALFLLGSAAGGRSVRTRSEAADALTELIGVGPTTVDDDDYGYDDDDYVEYTLPRPPEPAVVPARSRAGEDTEPLNARVEHPLIGFAHNGFHVDDEQRNRHYLGDPDDAADYGRHSFRDD